MRNGCVHQAAGASTGDQEKEEWRAGDITEKEKAKKIVLVTDLKEEDGHMIVSPLPPVEIAVVVIIALVVIPNDHLVMADWEQKFFISLLLLH